MIAVTSERRPLYGPATPAASERPSRPEPGNSGGGLLGLDLSDETCSAWISSVPRERTPKWGGRCRGVAAEPPCDPFQDQDALLELGEKITTLAAHINVAEHRFLRLVAEFDRRGGWKLGGHRSCADWLHYRVGLSRGAAREKVRTARALERMPLTSEAMRRGEISFSKARALTRVVDDLVEVEPQAEEEPPADGEEPPADGTATPAADPEREAELLTYARECTTAEVERLVRSWREITTLDEVELERRRHARRYLSVAPDGDGMYVVRGRLDPEVGALLMRAIEAASDALFREGDDWAPEGGRRGPRTRKVTPRQRRADAVGLLAERAMAAGFGLKREESEERDASEAGEADEEGHPAGEADGESCSCCSEAPLSGTRPERYQVFLHVSEETLRGEESVVGDGAREDGAETARRDSASCLPSAHESHLEDGTRVSAETSRRLACDASVVRVVRGADGSVLDVGRRTRTIPPALRRALEIRDGGCRFPGCGLRFTQGHHIIDWAKGGETKLSNLVSLCRTHHRGVHEDGFRVEMGRDGRPRFYDRTGWPIPDAPPPTRTGPNALERLIEENRRAGAHPGPNTPSARYKRRGDIPTELEDRAREALDPPGDGEPEEEPPEEAPDPPE